MSQETDQPRTDRTGGENLFVCIDGVAIALKPAYTTMVNVQGLISDV